MNRLAGNFTLIMRGGTDIGLATAPRFASKEVSVSLTGHRQRELDAAIRQIG